MVAGERRLPAASRTDETVMEELFDLLSDVYNESRWHPDFRGATKPTDGPVGKGTACELRYRGLGRMRVAITDSDRPPKLDGHVAAQGIEMDVAFRFSAGRRRRHARAVQGPRRPPRARAHCHRSWAPCSAASSPSARTRSCAPSPRSPGRSPASPDQPRPGRFARKATPGALAGVTVDAHGVGRQILRGVRATQDNLRSTAA
jgi:hypothetical protein